MKSIEIRRGFTLVELSIVLVAVGLIIGGLLVAQSIVGSVQVQKFVRDTQQYSIAVAGFQNKYKGLPGDSNKFLPVGNANGSIDGSTLNNFDGEVANFWPHLAQFGVRPNNKTLTSTVPAAGVTADINVPSIPYGAKGSGIFPVNALFTATQTNVNAKGNYFATAALPCAPTILYNCAYTNLAFKPTEGRAIDSKLDDGQPNTGLVLAGPAFLGANYNLASYGTEIPTLNLFVKMSFITEREDR